MKTSEKNLSKSNNRNTFKSKLKTLGGAGALSLLITLNSCGDKDMEVKKSADNYQKKVKKVETAKENGKDKQEALKDAQEDVQEAEKDYREAQKEAAEAKAEIKNESSKL